jgi:hypothetical protein
MVGHHDDRRESIVDGRVVVHQPRQLTGDEPRIGASRLSREQHQHRQQRTRCGCRVSGWQVDIRGTGAKSRDFAGGSRPRDHAVCRKFLRGLPNVCQVTARRCRHGVRGRVKRREVDQRGTGEAQSRAHGWICAVEPVDLNRANESQGCQTRQRGHGYPETTGLEGNARDGHNQAGQPQPCPHQDTERQSVGERPPYLCHEQVQPGDEEGCRAGEHGGALLPQRSWRRGDEAREGDHSDPG